MFLATLPGYAPKGHGDVQAVLTLAQLEQQFKKWLLNDYLVRVHSETNMTPKARWEDFPFVPRMPDSSEQLDLLLLTVTKTRRVRRDGIRFSGFRYFDVNLSGYIGEDVTIRYDPRDLGFIHVYSENSLVCIAACSELSGKTVSLKEVQQARNHESKVQRQQLKALLAIAEKHSPVIRPPERVEESFHATTISSIEYPKFKIKRFACDD